MSRVTLKWVASHINESCYTYRCDVILALYYVRVPVCLQKRQYMYVCVWPVFNMYTKMLMRMCMRRRRHGIVANPLTHTHTHTHTHMPAAASLGKHFVKLNNLTKSVIFQALSVCTPCPSFTPANHWINFFSFWCWMTSLSSWCLVVLVMFRHFTARHFSLCVYVLQAPKRWRKSSWFLVDHSICVARWRQPHPRAAFLCLLPWPSSSFGKRSLLHEGCTT